MSTIDIQRTHDAGLERARETVDKTAQRMREKFGAQTEWQGNVLHFRRSGIDGTIAVGAQTVQVNARLGMLLSALRPMIEQEIRRSLDEQFG